MGHFIVNQRQDFFAQTKRAHRQDLKPRWRNIAGNVIEYLPGVMADPRIGSEEADVRVNLGCDRVIIASTQMAIGAEAVCLAAHDKRDLGMGLHVDKAVDHLDARIFEL